MVTAAAWCSVCVHSLRVRSRGLICPDFPGRWLSCTMAARGTPTVLCPKAATAEPSRRRPVTRKHSWSVLGWRWGAVIPVWLGVLLPVRKVMSDREGRNYDHPQLSSQQRTRPCGGRAHKEKGKSWPVDLQALCSSVNPKDSGSPDAPDG